MVLYPHSICLPEITRRMKGAPSRAVRLARLPEVLRKLMGKAFWSPSYFVESCGGAPLEIIKTYVENQNAPDQPRKPPSSPPPKRKSAPYPRTDVRGVRPRR